MWRFLENIWHPPFVSWMRHVIRCNHYLSSQYMHAFHEFTKRPANSESLQALIDRLYVLMNEALQMQKQQSAHQPEHIRVMQENITHLLHILSKPAYISSQRFMESLLHVMIGLSALTIPPQPAQDFPALPFIKSSNSQKPEDLSIDQNIYITAIQEALKIIKKLKKQAVFSKEDNDEIDTIESKLIALV